MPWWGWVLVGLAGGFGLARLMLWQYRAGFVDAIAATYRATEAVKDGKSDAEMDFDALRMLVVLEDNLPTLIDALQRANAEEDQAAEKGSRRVDAVEAVRPFAVRRRPG